MRFAVSQYGVSRKQTVSRIRTLALVVSHAATSGRGEFRPARQLIWRIRCAELTQSLQSDYNGWVHEDPVSESTQ